MIEYLFQNTLALYIGGSIRYIYLRFICRKRDLSYNRVLHGITNAKTKEADTYNVKNDIKSRLTTLVFIIVLILMGIMFNVIP